MATPRCGRSARSRGRSAARARRAGPSPARERRRDRPEPHVWRAFGASSPSPDYRRALPRSVRDRDDADRVLVALEELKRLDLDAVLLLAPARGEADLERGAAPGWDGSRHIASAPAEHPAAFVQPLGEDDDVLRRRVGRVP